MAARGSAARYAARAVARAAAADDAELDATPVGGHAGAGLHGRAAGSAAIVQMLAAQAGRPERGALARLFGVDPLAPAARSWYLGAVGELAVADRLARLGPEWRVLHAVPAADGQRDIDHVVIGPAGVYTLNTKHHPGRRVFVSAGSFRVDGRVKDHYYVASKAEAAHASWALAERTGRQQWVTPVLVVVGARRLERGRGGSAVEVVGLDELVGWLTSRAPRIGRAALARLRAETEPSGAVDPGSERSESDELAPEVMARFDLLHAQVRLADRRRARWRRLALLGVAAVIGGTFALVPGLGRTALFLLAAFV